jgi:hypothetical protein
VPSSFVAALPEAEETAARSGRPRGPRSQRNSLAGDAEAAREAARKRAAYEAARLRSAVTMLRLAEATSRYGAAQLASGASPAEAKEAALYVAGELAIVAGELRRLTRLRPCERRVLAVRLSNLGMSREEVGARLGVSATSVRKYLRAEAPEMIGPSPWR